MSYQLIWDKLQGSVQGSLPSPTQGGTLETITVLALYRDGSAIDLSTMTLSATMTDKDGDTTAVTGTLTGANGSFTWKFSAGDIGTAGRFSVVVTYTDGAESWPSMPVTMDIIANPSANAVQNPALFGVSSTEAAWVTAGAAGGALAEMAYIDDAPGDGTQYARNNAAWEAVAASGGDFMADGSVPMTGGITIGQPSAVDFTFMTLDPSDTDALPFYGKLWTIAQAGRDNVGWNFGYNQSSGGGSQSNTDASFYLQMESHYNPTGIDPFFEYHLNAFTADGTIASRPFHINVYKDNIFTQIDLSSDELIMTGARGGGTMLKLFGAATPAAGQLQIFTPINVYADMTTRNQANTEGINFGVSGNSAYMKFIGTNPVIDGNTGTYLQFSNFAGLVLPGELGTLYSTPGFWDQAPYMTFAVNREIGLSGTGVIRHSSLKVLGARVIDARCDDTVDSGDATTDGVIDALRDAMIAHGLIAAA